MQAEHRRPLVAFLAVLCLAALIVGQALTERTVRREVGALQAAQVPPTSTLLFSDRLVSRQQPADPTARDVLVATLGVPGTFVGTPSDAPAPRLDTSTGSRSIVTTAALRTSSGAEPERATAPARPRARTATSRPRDAASARRGAVRGVRVVARAPQVSAPTDPPAPQAVAGVVVQAPRAGKASGHSTGTGRTSSRTERSRASRPTSSASGRGATVPRGRADRLDRPDRAERGRGSTASGGKASHGSKRQGSRGSHGRGR